VTSAFDDISQSSPTQTVGEGGEITLRREWHMPNSWTFEIQPIADLVEREIDNSDGVWVDPFAGKSEYADVTNDLHPERETDYTMKAVDFLSEFETKEVDGGVIFDPPYSATQLKRKYDDIGVEPNQSDTNASFFARNRDEIERVCSPGASVISFGWNSTGVGKSRGFSKREILLVCHGSSRNDTICVVEDYCP
jgi:hypothetical protein